MKYKLPKPGVWYCKKSQPYKWRAVTNIDTDEMFINIANVRLTLDRFWETYREIESDKIIPVEKEDFMDALSSTIDIRLAVRLKEKYLPKEDKRESANG